MSWQAVELVRDHSRATGQTRTIALVLASYANEEDGNGNPFGNVFPSIETIRKGTGARKDENGKLKGGATRKTVIDARRWLVANGEAEIVGTRPSHTGTPIPVLDFTPLHLRSQEPDNDEIDPRAPARATSDLDSDSEFPFPSVSGSASEPLGDAERTLGGDAERTLGVPPPNPSDAKGGHSEPLGGKGSLGEPLGGSGLSVSSAGAAAQTEAQRAVERREDEAELATLEGQLGTTGHPEATRRCIEELQKRLGHSEVAA